MEKKTLKELFQENTLENGKMHEWGTISRPSLQPMLIHIKSENPPINDIFSPTAAVVIMIDELSAEGNSIILGQFNPLTIISTLESLKETMEVLLLQLINEVK